MPSRQLVGFRLGLEKERRIELHAMNYRVSAVFYSLPLLRPATTGTLLSALACLASTSEKAYSFPWKEGVPLDMGGLSIQMSLFFCPPAPPAFHLMRLSFSALCT